MRRFFHALFAFLVVLGATGAELRLPEAPAGTCGCGCAHEPCGMPQRSPRPCGTGAPSAIAVPTRPVGVVVAATALAQSQWKEPRPWPAAWAWVSASLAGASAIQPLVPVGQGPPPLASERVTQLGVFRI